MPGVSQCDGDRMLHTAVCDVLGVRVPIVQAGMGPFGSGAELASAVSNAGALGTLGGAARTQDDLRTEVVRLKEATDRPFAVNFTQPWLQQSPQSLDLVLELGVPVISCALGDPGSYPKRAHDAGALFIQQVHTVAQARLVAERGVDVIIAQGTEAGGFGGTLTMSVLVPQVVDAVHPLPVLAAGGIADGRGLAAALVLGAQGANIGTRFLATTESSISETWKAGILAAESTGTVRATVWDSIFPKPGNGAFEVVPRALETEFLRRWQADPRSAAAEAGRLATAVREGIRAGRMEEFVPFTGQSAGIIHDVVPAALIVSRLVEQAEAALQDAQGFRSPA